MILSRPSATSFVARYALPATVALVGHVTVLFWPGLASSTHGHHLAGIGTGHPPLEVAMVEIKSAEAIPSAETFGETAIGREAELVSGDAPTSPPPAPLVAPLDAVMPVDLSFSRFSRRAKGRHAEANAAAVTSELCDALQSHAAHLSGSGAGQLAAFEPLVAPPPAYPPAARLQGRSGIVQLSVRLDATGRCRSTKVHISSGYDDFDQAAQDTVQKLWRFPRHLVAHDEPIIVAVRFELHRAHPEPTSRPDSSS